MLMKEILLFADDDQDVHFCGRCKLSFNDLSEYIKHKANKVCRDIVNKSSLTEVVDKLPIDAGSQSHSGEFKTSSAEDEASTDATQKAQEYSEGIEDDSAGCAFTPVRNWNGSGISSSLFPSFFPLHIKFLPILFKLHSTSGHTLKERLGVM